MGSLGFRRTWFIAMRRMHDHAEIRRDTLIVYAVSRAKTDKLRTGAGERLYLSIFSSYHCDALPGGCETGSVLEDDPEKPPAEP